jgi:hypothetical protein
MMTTANADKYSINNSKTSIIDHGMLMTGFESETLPLLTVNGAIMVRRDGVIPKPFRPVCMHL